MISVGYAVKIDDVFDGISMRANIILVRRRLAWRQLAEREGKVVSASGNRRAAASQNYQKRFCDENYSLPHRAEFRSGNRVFPILNAIE